LAPALSIRNRDVYLDQKSFVTSSLVAALSVKISGSQPLMFVLPETFLPPS